MDKASSDQETNGLLKEIAALLAVLVKRGSIQSTVIKELGSVGLSPKRIAELLGTTPNTVNVALHKARHSKTKKSPKK